MIIWKLPITAALFLLIMAVSQARATPFVTFTTTDLGEGVFEYDLTLSNSGGVEPLDGLIIVNGSSVFGLDETSVIGAPDAWLFFPPLPPIFDPLFYFSEMITADVPVGGSLVGFSFETTKDPSTVMGSDFTVVGIGATSGRQIPLGTAQAIPEPRTSLLSAIGLATLLVCYFSGRRTRAMQSKSVCGTGDAGSTRCMDRVLPPRG